MPGHDQPTHIIYMVFFLCRGWNVQFLLSDCRTPLPRRFTYSSPEPIRDLARRAGALATVEAEEQLDTEIETGSGGLYPTSHMTSTGSCGREPPKRNQQNQTSWCRCEDFCPWSGPSTWLGSQGGKDSRA